MRLRQHLNEAYQSEIYKEYINDNIHTHCKQYLKLIKGKNPLYRGIDVFWDSGIKDVRKDRRPFGMEIDEADYLNDWLQKNGHMRRDKSVMAISNPEDLDLFGEPYHFFPLDPIKGYTWAETKDLNMVDQRTGWSDFTVRAWKMKKNNEISIDDEWVFRMEGELKGLKKPFEDYFHTNKGFNTAYKNGYEIWFNCVRYYFVTTNIPWDKNKQIFIL